MDIYGDHALSCCGGGDRIKRHNVIRNQAYYECAAAGLHPELEKPGLLQPRPCLGSTPEDGIHRDNPAARRPADVYLPRWRHGTPVALDFAVTSGLRPSVAQHTVQDAGAASRNYEDFKNNFLDTRRICADEGIKFAPMVVEAVGGGWGPTATKMLYSLAKTKSSITGETVNSTLNNIHQNLGIRRHRENARAILRRCAPPRNSSDAVQGILTTAAFLAGED